MPPVYDEGQPQAVLRGGVMSERFTATLPDGSESRVGWLMWMLAGLWVSRLLASGVILLEAVYELVWPGGVSDAAQALLTVAQIAVLALLLAAAVSFARIRMLMPEAVWLSLAAGPAVTWLLALRDTVQGEPPILVSLAIPLTGAVLGAWLVLRVRSQAK